MTRTDIDIQALKTKLEEERARLEAELATLGTQNTENPGDWEAKSAGFDDTADPNERADSIEEFEDRVAILAPLEIQFNEVKAALQRIEDGTYGICQVSGEPIEAKRLEANPSATTCMAHMNG
jgi:RNA polymerase-binding transcription factor DksA